MVDPRYKVAPNFTGGLLGTVHPKYGRQLWTRARMTRRHRHDACVLCGAEVGAEAFLPLTNRSNRMARICLRHARGGGGD